MKKLSALLLVVLFAVACSSTSGSMADAGSPASGGSTSASKATPTHYRLLSDPRTVREINWSRPPLDLHIKGRMTTLGFEPVNQVQGSGRLCADGKDWISLTDGLYHAGTEGSSPQGPYVMGCKSKTGGFVPASKQISNS